MVPIYGKVWTIAGDRDLRDRLTEVAGARDVNQLTREVTSHGLWISGGRQCGYCGGPDGGSGLNS
jgi:hypothetical protein